MQEIQSLVDRMIYGVISLMAGLSWGLVAGSLLLTGGNFLFALCALGGAATAIWGLVRLFFKKPI